MVIEVDGTDLPEETPVFVRGIECRAQEARFGGIVIQPVEA